MRAIGRMMLDTGANSYATRRTMTGQRWAETPMFMLRRDCVTRAISCWPAGRFLEVGAGTGALTQSFLVRGFTGVCYDLGDANRQVLRLNLARFGAAIEVVDSLTQLDHGTFDYIAAFEVLEHIDADAEALRLWARYLKPGGRIIVSVPAHMSKFNDQDRSVGHYRRYEKLDLQRLFETAGCSDTRIWSYGFPLAVFTRRGNQMLTRLTGSQKLAGEQATPERLSIRSGVERSEVSLRLSRILTERTLAPFIVLQRAFFGTDLGDGYVVEGLYRPRSQLVGAS
jgi:SAM-dependent methyltransferase